MLDRRGGGGGLSLKKGIAGDSSSAYPGLAAGIESSSNSGFRGDESSCEISSPLVAERADTGLTAGLLLTE